MIRLRWWVIGGWVLAALGSVLWLPTLSESEGGGSGLKGLLSVDTPAVRTELRSLDVFGFPLIARTVLVQRDPDGLSVYAQARTGTNAAAVNQGKYADVGPILGALPLTNALSLFPAARERDNTTLTYLFVDPKASFGRQQRAAERYGDRHFAPRDHVVGVTGSVPARATQGRIIVDALPLVEALTLAAILLIVMVAFRSLVAPVLALGVAGLAYVVTLRLSGALAELVGVATPSELEPVVVAMLLGVVTDYVVFFFSASRTELAHTSDGREAALRATARFGPIVAVAGLAVAVGTAALFAAASPFFRALAPALVFTVVVGLTVSLTLVPALMAVVGRFVFWPSRTRRVPAEEGQVPSDKSPVGRIARNRSVAGAVVAGCLCLLTLAALPLLRLELGVSFVDSLPADTDVRRAADAAQAGFADGILSPTVVLVEESGVGSQRRELARLGSLLEAEPGVAGVVGPSDVPVDQALGVVVARSGDAARFLVVLSDEPLGAAAIASVDHLQERLPVLLQESGLGEASAGLGGDTATATYIVSQTQSDLMRIAVAALLINFLMLLLFLRAVVAAVFLLAASLLSVSAALGLTTLVFDNAAPGQGLTFYVPFAAAVLLLAFGSDYNIFGVGHVWDEARHRPLSEAIMVAMPSTARALIAAGMALAASFGFLAAVELLPFRQLAFAMAVGITIDVFVVRLLLVPALLTLVGPVSAWPSRRLRPAPQLGPTSRQPGKR